MLFIHIDRIYLDEMAGLINRKDNRPTKTWCQKNNVKVYKDTTGEFVYRSEFELANDMPLILDLKLVHGKDWEQYYEEHLKGTLYKLLDFKSDKPNKNNGYIPKGEISKKLFGGS
ncbi:hypothetical protein [Flavobacterium aciduliphilum]|uniref:Uncharacterized protein n=1 Tax=Flavobacterium aciduliphilum TaxID=1101402 RepID=A0A328YIJ8_9FLAO|nr:hypothetical protein [Flavobacterium aciduliphilum]RAR72545.1 hypothetical protein CLV55_105115 [Flavobacterium aciduliphilum]